MQNTLTSPNNPVSSEALSDDTFSWASSLLYLGGFIGCFIWNDLADRFGRKVTGCITGATQVFGWLGIILTQNSTQLCLARFLMGIGGSGIIINSALYINETARSDLASQLSCLIMICMNAGILLVNLFGHSFTYTTLNYICFLVAFSFMIFILWLPETPLYLLVKGRTSEAKNVLLWYRGGVESVAVLELASLRQSSQAMLDRKTVPYSEVVSSKETAMATTVIVVLLTGQQLSGLPVVLAYTDNVLRIAGTSLDPFKSILIVYSLLVVASASSGSLINYVNKKYLLFFSYLGAFFAFMLFSLYYLDTKSGILSDFKWLPTASLVIYIICYSIGLGPVPYAMCPSMFSPHILNNVMSIAMMSSILTAFGTVKIFPNLKNSLGDSGTFFILAMNNLLLSLFVFIFVSKQKNKDVKNDAKNDSIN